MKGHFLELVMACLLLVSFYFLAKEAAVVSNEIHQEKVIVVDSGHGGDDPGMVGVDGLEEKNINLAIALKLKEILEQKDFTVVMTRDTDTGLYQEGEKNQKVQDMKARVQLINDTAPRLTVSIHQNSYQDESIHGAQVFYYTHSQEGEEAAKIMQKALLEVDEENHRQAKADSTYYLLKRTEVPTIIVECGFLSNPEEAEKLVNEEYQQQLAQAIVQGIETCLTD